MKRIVAQPLEAVVNVVIADRALANAVATRIERAVQVPALPRARLVRVRTRRRARAIDPAGKFVVVRVTATNARHLPAIVAAVRPNAAGVQLVWNGHEPPRERVERHLFAVLENARSTPAAPPVVLAATDELALALRLLARSRKEAS